jgi:hypothetical protein
MYNPMTGTIARRNHGVVAVFTTKVAATFKKTKEIKIGSAGFQYFPEAETTLAMFKAVTHGVKKNSDD